MKNKLITILWFGAVQQFTLGQNPKPIFDHTSSLRSASDRAALISVRDQIRETNNNPKMLLLPATMNTLQQRKVLGYLTGTSDLSISSFNATYSSEDDRLNFGVNFPIYNTTTYRLKGLISPIIEADIKSSFSSIYKEGKWDSDNMRVGVKYTYLAPKSRIYWFNNQESTRRQELRLERTRNYYYFIDSLLLDNKKDKGRITAIDGDNSFSRHTFEMDTVYKKPADRDQKELKKSAVNYIADKEADFVEENKNYNLFTTTWLSFWGMLPVSETKRYVSPDSIHPFDQVRYVNWEINAQWSYLLDWRKGGTVYLSTWFKVHSNNTAEAELLKSADYYQYQSYPQATSQYLSVAVFENNKAFVGNFDRFLTGNLNFQIVYMTPWRDYAVRPGISARYELNIGNYCPSNFRFGVPLAIKGKEAPINLEFQIRFDDVNNYSRQAEFTMKPSFGLSVGLPVSPLY